jgi:predicted  nucleic acid-binding Zn-ribbon protein
VAPESERGVERLLELQEIDLSIDRLTSRRDVIQGGDEAEAARKLRDEARGRLGELRLALDSVDAETRRLEGDVDSLTRKAGAEESRLYDGSVANPKELEAIQHEVASLRGRRSRIEDELLDQMVRKEDLEERIRQAEAELVEAEDRLGEIMGHAAVELDEIDAALAERTRERASLLPSFDEELLELYEDLRRQKKGVGAAALIDGVCQGCHQRLSALELDRLKRGTGIRRCEYCRRILVVS